MNSAPYEFVLISGSSSRAGKANTAAGLLVSLFVKVILGTHRTSRTLLGHKGSAPLCSPNIYGHGQLRCGILPSPQAVPPEGNTSPRTPALKLAAHGYTKEPSNTEVSPIGSLAQALTPRTDMAGRHRGNRRELLH